MPPELLDIIGRSLRAIGWAFMPFLLTPLLALVFPKLQALRNFLTALIQIIDGFNMRIGEAVKWLLPVLVVSIAFGVIALSIFGQAWTKIDESAIYFHATIILLGSGATLLAGKHVRVDIFHANMLPKSKAYVDFLGFYALMLPFCLVLLWNSQSFVALSWASLEGSAESDGIKGLFALKTFVSIFALMMLTQSLSLAGRAALFINGHVVPPLPRNIDDPFAGKHAGEGL